MSDLLTPEEVEHQLVLMDAFGGYDAFRATLRAYAEVVEAVAEVDPVGWQGDTWYESECVFCGLEAGVDKVVVHSPDCTYILARKLRGKDG